jgi:hypothetical protein
MGHGDYELTAVQVADAIGGIVGDATIRNWVHSGALPSAYVWRSPTGRLFFKHKVVAWLLAQDGPPPAAPAPKKTSVKPVRWDRAS